MTDQSGVQPPAPPAVSAAADPRGDFLAKATVALIFSIIGFVLILVILSAFGLKPDPGLITIVVQVVSTVLGLGITLWGFQYGSSKGSQAKDAQIAALTPPPTTQA